LQASEARQRMRQQRPRTLQPEEPGEAALGGPATRCLSSWLRRKSQEPPLDCLLPRCGLNSQAHVLNRVPSFGIDENTTVGRRALIWVQSNASQPGAPQRERALIMEVGGARSLPRIAHVCTPPETPPFSLRHSTFHARHCDASRRHRSGPRGARLTPRRRIGIAQERLTFAGKQPHDSATIAECGLRDGSTSPATCHLSTG